MVSNDVEALDRQPVRGAAADGEGEDDRAARRLAALRDDYLLLTEVGLGEWCGGMLVRMRLRGSARSSWSRTRPTSSSTGRWKGSPDRDFGAPAVELVDTDLVPIGRRGRARAPSNRLPGHRGGGASSTIGCSPRRPASTSTRSGSRRAAIPGQEPIARLHHRGHPNRGLRVLAIGRRAPRPRRRAHDRREGRRQGHERRARRGASLPSDTFAAR